MPTLQFARFAGTCAVCRDKYGVGARIGNTPYGWAHDGCFALFREKRIQVGKALAAAGQPQNRR